MDKIERRSGSEDFWKDPEAAQKLLQRRKRLESDLDLLKRLQAQEDDTRVLVEWLAGGEDVEKDLRAALDALEQTLEGAEFQKMLGGEHDRANAILTINSGAAGGQHVNVTDSAVRITHLPTGIVVACQNERSQIRNREVGMKILKSRLYDLEMQKRREKLDVVESSKKDIAFGSQIRSYVMHPYRMVKDHRTKFEIGDVDRVMDGDLDGLIKSALVARARGTLGQAAAGAD